MAVVSDILKRNGGLPNSADTIEESGVGRDKHVMDGLKLGFTPDKFCVNDDSSKIAAVADGATQRFAVIDGDGAVTHYTGTGIFTAGIDNLCFLDSSTVLTTAVTTDGASKNLLTKVG